MNGIINIFKPPGLTSHDVVSHVRRKLGLKRVGHTGTLDPMATGVLPICVGPATKIVEYLMDDQKKYRFEVTFGYETDTLDAWGKTVRTSSVNTVERADLETVLHEMTGEVMQIPPQYSALKVDGRRAYDLARNDEHVELKARSIVIGRMDIIQYAPERAIIDVTCSKGTYVRSIARDIGSALNTYGTMTFLLRMQTGAFDYESAIPLQQFMDAENPEIYINPIDFAVHFPPVNIEGDERLISQISNGVPLSLNRFDQCKDPGKRLIYLRSELLGIGEYMEGQLKITKRF